MQPEARKTNLSETTFIFPRDATVEARDGVRVRIFTPKQELPFAGHPTLCTAMALWHRRGGEKIVLDLPIGRIRVTFERRKDGTVLGEMVQPDPEFHEAHKPE